MSEENKALMRRELEEVWNKHNPDAVDEIYAPDFVHHNAPPGMPNDRKTHKALVGMYLGAFPDLKSTIDILVAEGDMVVSRSTGTGTHTGELMGIAPTGKRMTVTTIAISRIAGGKIAEMWSEVDTMGMMQQLGVVPAPAG
jgi:predicted ester cyclase